MSTVSILIVEDEDRKRQYIEDFLQQILPNANLLISKSVRSALQLLRNQLPDLIILDMSLPTFDIDNTETGGRPQGFGGIELMRMMELEDLLCPVLIVTGYEEFSKDNNHVTLKELTEKIEKAHPTIFHGALHFSSAYGDWKSNLKEKIASYEFLK